MALGGVVMVFHDEVGWETPRASYPLLLVQRLDRFQTWVEAPGKLHRGEVCTGAGLLVLVPVCAPAALLRGWLSLLLQADQRFFARTTNVTLGLLVPIIILGGAVSYMRLEWWSKLVQMRYRNATPGLKARRIYKFLDPKEVGPLQGWWA